MAKLDLDLKQFLSGAILMSYPTAKYVKGGSCEDLQEDDHYQDADELQIKKVNAVRDLQNISSAH